MKSGSRKPSDRKLTSYRSSLGRRGEEFAATFFASKGFIILERNWSCRFGEIDLIIKKGEEVRFIEVKCRRTHAFGYPETSVTAKKLRHLQIAMELWLRTQPSLPRHYQADVLAISWLAGSTEPGVEWIQGV